MTTTYAEIGAAIKAKKGAGEDVKEEVRRLPACPRGPLLRMVGPYRAAKRLLACARCACAVPCQVGKLTALKEEYEELTGDAMPGQKPSKKLAKKLKAAKKAGGGAPAP